MAEKEITKEQLLELIKPSNRTITLLGYSVKAKEVEPKDGFRQYKSENPQWTIRIGQTDEKE